MLLFLMGMDRGRQLHPLWSGRAIHIGAAAEVFRRIRAQAGGTA